MQPVVIRARARAVLVALTVGLAVVVSGPVANEAAQADEYPQAGLDASAPAAAGSVQQSWLGRLSRLERRTSGVAVETNAVLANVSALAETAARRVNKNKQPSAVLAKDPRVGDFAAPIKRFRDGGHAYYLFGRGLHSCTYIGKCMDLFAAVGEPVFAMADGILQIPPYAGGSYGHHLTIRFRDKSEAIYAHLQKITAKPGKVKAGALIGYVGCSGTSGESSGCSSADAHLHLEWSALKWSEGEYGELPPAFHKWRGHPARCYQGC